MGARVVALPQEEFEAAMEELAIEQSDDGFANESDDDE